MESVKGKKSEAATVLSSACALNLPLDLRIIGDRSKTEYRSRFLNFDESSKKPVLLIEAPTSKGNVVPVRPDRRAKVLFSFDGRSRSFESHILGRGKFRLSPTVTVPSLELLVPEEISSGEKRSFYRIFVADTSPIKLDLGVLSKEEGGSRRIRSREKGLLTDLGGGGLGFRIAEGRSLLLGVGARLSLSFRLPGEDERIKVLGRICFSLRRPEVREVFFGVQFTELESDVEYKRSVDRILRFVAEWQRQNLSNRIRIND